MDEFYPMNFVNEVIQGGIYQNYLPLSLMGKNVNLYYLPSLGENFITKLPLVHLIGQFKNM
jgi:hypothetical protein